MPCPDLYHNGLASSSYSGPTNSIEQYALGDALVPYGMEFHQMPTLRAPHQTAFEMRDWDVQYPGQIVGNNTFAVTSGVFAFRALGGGVSIDLRTDIAQREPVSPREAPLTREYFDVSGCGALVTAACAFVAKSTPWEALAVGGTAKISSKYTGNNLPDIERTVHSAGLSPAWQFARPYGQPVKLSLRADADSVMYDGHSGSKFSGGLYIAGSMSDLPKTAAAQASVLGKITDDPAKAERTVAHAYGGTADALHEAWARALSNETEMPTEAAQLAYDILTR